MLGQGHKFAHSPGVMLRVCVLVERIRSLTLCAATEDVKIVYIVDQQFDFFVVVFLE